MPRPEPYQLAPAAIGDLDEIDQAIAADSVDAADRVLAEIRDAMIELARHPHLGHPRPDLTPLPVRFWRVRSYLVVYRPETTPLQVIRVLHGARDLRHLLSS